MSIDNRKALEDANIDIQIHIIDHCKCCWVPISNTKRKKVNLWCNNCRKYVDAELNWWDEHPFNFYFQHYQECKNKTKSNVRDAESE